MKVLLLIQAMISHQWVTRIINVYLRHKSMKGLVQCREDNKHEIGDFWWSVFGRCYAYDYEFFFMKFDTIIYIIRDPVKAMWIWYFWSGSTIEPEFFKKFVDIHLTEYAMHVKAHKKIISFAVSFDRLVDDIDCFIELMKYFDPNVDETEFRKIYTEIRPFPIDLSLISEDLQQYIRDKWRSFGLE